MKITTYLLSLILLPILSYAQTDVGIVNLKVVKPYEVLDGGSLSSGDTIEQIQFEIKNYMGAAITSADLPGGQNTLHVSYNGQTKIVNVPLLGSISSQGTRQEKVPEDFSTLKLLPPFPTSETSLEVCVKTVNTGDPDDTNNEACMTISIGGGGVYIVEETQKSNMSFWLDNRMLMHSTDLQIQDLKIFNLSGKLVLQLKDENRVEQDLNLDSFKSGVYFISAKTTDGELLEERLVIP